MNAQQRTIDLLTSLGYVLTENTVWPTYGKIENGIQYSVMVTFDGRQSNYWQCAVDKT
ncbi:MAG: hypothetical protein ACXABU_17905 [Candidatus Hodarchaeales archaeon]|jgi:hypothetical protein